MADHRSSYTTAAAEVQKLEQRPSNDQLLALYAMQAYVELVEKLKKG